MLRKFAKVCVCSTATWNWDLHMMADVCVSSQETWSDIRKMSPPIEAQMSYRPVIRLIGNLELWRVWLDTRTLNCWVSSIHMAVERSWFYHLLEFHLLQMLTASATCNSKSGCLIVLFPHLCLWISQILTSITISLVKTTYTSLRMSQLWGEIWSGSSLCA